MSGASTERGVGSSQTPPPPRAPGDRMSWGEPEAQPGAPHLRPRSTGHRFDAELDMTELDDRDRPGPTWSGRGRELSRSHLVLRSRRMCYVGKQILVAIHLIDDRPVPLLGRVFSCEYDGDGQYKIGLDLHPIPERPEIRDWILARG